MNLRLILVVFICLQLSCSENAFNEFADTDTDAAIHQDAIILMNDSDFSAAIVKFQTLSTSYLANREVKYDYASAYAGLCGLRLLSLVETLSNTTSSSLLTIMMAAFSGSTSTSVDACKSAETLLDEISTDASARTDKENFLAAFVGFAKIGAILSLYADTDDDDATDAAFDACDINDIPESETAHIITGLARVIAALGALSSNPIGSDELTSITSLCTSIESIPGLGSSFNFCSDTDATAVQSDTSKQFAVRLFISEGNDGVGIGSCGQATPSMTNCAVPCDTAYTLN